MRIITFIVFFLTISLYSNQLTSIRLSNTSDKSRLVFDFTNRPEKKIYFLKESNRIIIELKKVKLNSKVSPYNFSSTNPFIKSIRLTIVNKENLKVLIDLRKKSNYKDLYLKPEKNYTHRLILDLFEISKAIVQKIPVSIQTKDLSQRLRQAKKKKFIIVIDAGHGGKDPGAIGDSGLKEKDITLSIAKKVAELVRMQPGLEPVLIRSDDRYIELKKRIDESTKIKADLFVSIHADSFTNKKARGSSAYILSPQGAYDEVMKTLTLSLKPSKTLPGFMSVEDNPTASLLLSLPNASILNESQKAAQSILDELKRINNLHHPNVRRAEFTVLRSLSIPSVLIETDFVSNFNSEKNLNSSEFQYKIAKAIFEGIRNYFYYKNVIKI